MTLTAADLHGVIPPVVTPFTDADEIDADAFAAELRFLAQFPVGGVLVGAATGEGFALQPEETAQLCRIAGQVLDEGRPLIAGVVAASTRAAVASAVAAAEAGAGALMVTPVTYFATGEEGLVQHFTAVAAESGLPIMIYNSLPHNPVAATTLTRLVEVPGVISIKQGMGGTLAELRGLVAAVGDRVRVMWSQDLLLFPGYCLGAAGSLASIDAVLPRHSTELFQAVRGGNLDVARQLDRDISAVAACLGPTDWPSAVKTAINLQGRAVGQPRAPYQPLTGERRQHLETALKAAGVLA